MTLFAKLGTITEMGDIPGASPKSGRVSWWPRRQWVWPMPFLWGTG